MPVQYLQGDITLDSADIIVNTVNCVGVAGKGVALAFKQRWPQIMMDYTDACHTKRLKPGKCLLFPHPDAPTTRFWAAMATKDDWRKPSQYEWIESGLTELARLAHSVNAKTIAIPMAGCGNGGLDWNRVRPMVLTILSEFDLHIYGSSH
jgi:O-acetyl-ADP-ribose deacetylase (regulator of RNase III)